MYTRVLYVNDDLGYDFKNMEVTKSIINHTG